MLASAATLSGSLVAAWPRELSGWAAAPGTHLLFALLASYLCTYLLHSTVLLAAAWAVERFARPGSPLVREWLWKAAATLGLLTAAAQLAWPQARPTLTLHLPGPAAKMAASHAVERLVNMSRVRAAVPAAPPAVNSAAGTRMRRPVGRPGQLAAADASAMGSAPAAPREFAADGNGSHGARSPLTGAGTAEAGG